MTPATNLVALSLLSIAMNFIGILNAQELPTEVLPPKQGTGESAKSALESATSNLSTSETKKSLGSKTSSDNDSEQDDYQKEEQQIRQSAEAFVAAYNAHDALAVSQLFALDAEFTDEDGDLVRGRKAILQDFAEMFSKFPQCKIEVDVESLRVLTPNIAIEEGVIRGYPEPDQKPNISGYVAIHVRVGDTWQVASVSDFEAESEQLTPREHLQELSWMEGVWIDENPESIVKSTCQWDNSGNYLLHEFELKFAGVVLSNGSMRIGWDSLTQQIKSWTFGADGGYSEGLWIRDDNEWTVKLRGVSADGEVTSATSVFVFVDDDTMTWRSYDRTVGGRSTDDIPANVIKRHVAPPQD
ncbi:YybH family protein [Schlesneria paludicola]|uniref:YybH family protein n=1 Tax=Schlesneria paludicola TaxID=360056 RepID=UPI00029A3142|nr:SgcJ/EcaC family oxidoreductase [Schlesneria paludicola]